MCTLGSGQRPWPQSLEVDPRVATTPVSRHLLPGGTLIQAEICSEPKAGYFWLPPSRTVRLYPINSWRYAWSRQSHNLPSLPQWARAQA